MRGNNVSCSKGGVFGLKGCRVLARMWRSWVDLACMLSPAFACPGFPKRTGSSGHEAVLEPVPETGPEAQQGPAKCAVAEEAATGAPGSLLESLEEVEEPRALPAACNTDDSVTAARGHWTLEVRLEVLQGGVVVLHLAMPEEAAVERPAAEVGTEESLHEQQADAPVSHATATLSLDASAQVCMLCRHAFIVEARVSFLRGVGLNTWHACLWS